MGHSKTTDGKDPEHKTAYMMGVHVLGVCYASEVVSVTYKS